MSVTLQDGAEQAVTEEITQAMQTLHRRIIRDLTIAGEEAVKKARGIVTAGGGGGGVLPPYTVQTGNLVSSVGYAVVQDGQIVTMSSFQAIQGRPDENGIPMGDGQEGSATGKAYVKELAMRFPQGYALILVAGMHYASYVQELYHRDVLVSGSLVAEQLVREIQDKFKNEK
jgi:hypothetical protein